MNGLNRVILFGNLGADPELRMTNSGQSVLKMRLATSESYLDRNKVRQERTEWHSVVVWGKRAEGLGKFMSKGDRVLIEGRLNTSSYQDRDGNKRYKTEVVANEVIISGRGGQAAPQQQGQESSGDEYGDSGGGDDDIPF